MRPTLALSCLLGIPFLPARAQAAPEPPILRTVAEAAPGQSGLLATAQAQEPVTFEWTVANGAFEGEATGASVAFTAGQPGMLWLTCVAVAPDGRRSAPAVAQVEVQGSFLITVRAPEAVTAGKDGWLAAVSVPEGLACAWRLEGGVVTGGEGTDTIRFQAGAPGILTVRCALPDQPDPIPAYVRVVPPPALEGLAAPAWVTALREAEATARVPEGCACRWEIAGGTLVQGGEGGTVRFVAGRPGEARLTCRVVNAAGDEAPPATVCVRVAPAPLAPVLAAPAEVAAEGPGRVAVVQPQEGMRYRWEIGQGRRLGEDGGTEVRFLAGGGGQVTVCCRAEGPDGSLSPPAAGVIPVVAPGRLPLEAPAQATQGRPLEARVQAPPGSVCRWTLEGPAGTRIDAGQGGPQVRIQTAAPGLLRLACRITSPAGQARLAGPVRVRVLPAPAIERLELSAGRITRGASVTLVAHYRGGHGVLMPGGQEVPDGVPVTLQPAAETVCDLWVTSPAGEVARQSRLLEVVPLPTIASFTASSHLVMAGEAVNLRAEFDPGPLGEATVDPDVGPVASGQELEIRPAASGTYTLAVSNGAGAVATAQVQVWVGEPMAFRSSSGCPPGCGRYRAAASSAAPFRAGP